MSDFPTSGSEIDELAHNFSQQDSIFAPSDFEDKMLVLPEVYIVEDDRLLGMSVKKFLESQFNVQCSLFISPNEILDFLINKKTKSSFLLITDMSFENNASDGLFLIDGLREKNYHFSSIIMTGFGSIETAISATKKGVFHYLTKPFDLSILADLLEAAFRKDLKIDDSAFLQLRKLEHLAEKTPSLTSPRFKKFKLEYPTEEDMFCGMVGRSKAMKDIFERIRKVADSDSTVMITGPSGTGKELVTMALHKLCHRNENRLVSVNCGAIPAELLESELFGHKKGSFTGAISDRKGRFELANQGTIFLDEIGDMPLLLQVKLLRVLQSRLVEPVGSTQTVPIDVRIITATHRNIEEAVLQGDFREDLYYRLNVIPIRMPALCERREDIPLLISYFLKKFVSADGRNTIDFEDNVLDLLMGHLWPGNVRELENLIERLVILRGGNKIRVADLPAKFTMNNPVPGMYEHLINLPDEGIDLKQALADIEDSLVDQALQRTKGNKNQASKILRLNRTTLIEKLKKRGILTT